MFPFTLFGILFDVRATILAGLCICSVFQAHIVRAFIEVNYLKLYYFDTFLLLFIIITLFKSIGKSAKVLRIYLKHINIFYIIMVFFLALKVVQSGITVDALRNMALFYYFLLIPPLVFLVADFKTIIRICIRLITYSYCFNTVFLLVIIVVASVGFKEDFFIQTSRGIDRPVSDIFQLVPVGAILLTSSITAALLPDKSVRLVVKLPYIIYIIANALTYFNRSLFLGVAAGLFIGWYCKQKIKTALITGVALIFFALLVGPSVLSSLSEQHSSSSTWRLAVWQVTMESILENAIFGHSFATTTIESLDLEDESLENISIGKKARYAHNSYLTILYYGGFLFGGVLIFVLLWVFIRLFKSARRAHFERISDRYVAPLLRAYTAALVCAGLNVVLESPREAVAFWVLFSMSIMYLLFVGPVEEWVIPKKNIRQSTSEPSIPILQHREDL